MKKESKQPSGTSDAGHQTWNLTPKSPMLYPLHHLLCGNLFPLMQMGGIIAREPTLGKPAAHCLAQSLLSKGKLELSSNGRSCSSQRYAEIPGTFLENSITNVSIVHVYIHAHTENFQSFL